MRKVIRTLSDIRHVPFVLSVVCVLSFMSAGPNPLTVSLYAVLVGAEILYRIFD